MEVFHSLNVLARGLGRFTVGIIQLAAVEKLGSRVCVGTASPGTNGPDQLCVNFPVADSFHHGQVFEVVVRLEEGISRKEFHNNAPYAPNIAGETPSELQYDLRGSVMPSRDH